MDANLRARDAVHKANFRPSLLQATADTIQAGIRLDEAEVLAHLVEHEMARKREEARKRGRKESTEKHHHRKFVIMKGGEGSGGRSGGVEASYTGEDGRRTYRTFEDRRFGLALAGRRQQLTGQATAGGGIRASGRVGRTWFGGTHGGPGGGGGHGEGEVERFIYPEEPPLDYSFTLISTVEEIVTMPEAPQTQRSNRQPRKTLDEMFITSALRLSYNVLTNFDAFISTLYKILEPGPFGLCWLDVSFNKIDCFDDEAFSQLPNLRILYAHGNLIADMFEVRKLRSLSSLHTLTLHGNPIERDPAYRDTVLYYMPHLKRLDYFPVTKSDKASSSRFGPLNERHWGKKHGELAGEAQEIRKETEKSLTEKLMATLDL